MRIDKTLTKMTLNQKYNRLTYGVIDAYWENIRKSRIKLSIKYDPIISDKVLYMYIYVHIYAYDQTNTLLDLVVSSLCLTKISKRTSLHIMSLQIIIV